MEKHFFAFLLFSSAFIYAQPGSAPKRSCGSVVPDKAWDEWFNGQVEAFKSNLTLQRQQTSYVIPVIFHVIHGGQAVGAFPNISQAQLNSQIDVLNADYGGSGFNVGNFAGTNFPLSLVGNSGVTFCLAEKDPSGTVLAEKGIQRINYTTMSWADPASFNSSGTFKTFVDNTVKANTIWNPAHYLNIWVTDVNAGLSLLGYATFPPGTGLAGLSGPGTVSDDGVWCWARAVGNVGFLASGYDKGRTATHEIGHYLGLRHIWGDSNCGTDYCNDTPTQLKDNVGCPAFPSVTCGNGPNGDLFMNFMDYSNYPCMYMFTNDQGTRMQTAMASSPLRNQLTASAATLCSGGFIPCSYTVSNFSATDTLQASRRATAAVNDAQCPQGSGKAGYLGGTNCYGDKEKAEFIGASNYAAANNPVITGVVVLFFQYNNLGTDGSGVVGMNIYSGTSAAAAPGALLGSTSENLSVIASSTNTNSVPYCGNPNLGFALPVIMPYKFSFSTPIPVPQSGGFFASVVLPNTAGDTVAIMDKLTGTSNTAWERWDNNSWNDMKTAWGNVRNFNLAILPVIECGPVGIEERSRESSFGSVNLFPNPSTGNFYVMTNLPSSKELAVTVYNVLGQAVFYKKVEESKQHLIDIDLSAQANGVYFVELNNGQDKLVKRLVLTH